MKYSFLALLTTSILLTSTLASAKDSQCAQEGERLGLDTRVLLSELMVGALSCRQNDHYNAVVEKFQPHFTKNGEMMREYFNRVYGGKAGHEIDQFVTRMANDASERSMQADKQDFCRKMNRMFKQTLAMNDKEFLKFVSDKQFDMHHIDVCPAYKLVQKQ